MLNVWSYGMGVQSVTIAFLIYNGRLPKPDRVIVADTDREYKEGWKYTSEIIAPRLAEIGLTIEVASHSLATVDLYSEKGELLIPAYDATRVNKRGDHPKLNTFCSNEWKQRVVRRYIGGYEANRGGVQMWLGMSLDELGRLKKSDVGWCQNYYPLCFDVKMKRGECKDYILAQGVRLPSKSRCWGCPHQDEDEWIEIQNSPDEWEKAIALDEQIYASHKARLHKSCLPLSQVVFVPRGKDTREPLLSCSSGWCWM